MQVLEELQKMDLRLERLRLSGNGIQATGLAKVTECPGLQGVLMHIQGTCNLERDIVPLLLQINLMCCAKLGGDGPITFAGLL